MRFTLFNLLQKRAAFHPSIFALNKMALYEGEAFARKLDETGVKVTSTRYNGMIHDWGLLNVLGKIPGTQSAMLQAAVELKKALK